MPDPERLFRDAEGAALERVARLEDENRRLRAEVQRLSTRGEARGQPSPTHPLPGRFFVLAMALPLGMIALLLAVGPRHHTRSCAPSPYGEAFAPRGFQMAPHVPVSVDAKSPPASCAPPFTVDAHGYRHYKLECLR